jgi:hypothetical protein
VSARAVSSAEAFAEVPNPVLLVERSVHDTVIAVKHQVDAVDGNADAGEDLSEISFGPELASVSNGTPCTEAMNLTAEDSMEQRTTVSLKLAIMALALLLGLIALGQLFEPRVKAQAEGARFDHVLIVSTMFVHKGQIGLLLLDRRNGNVWFVQTSIDESRQVPFGEPVFLVRVPFEKLDQAPHAER